MAIPNGFSETLARILIEHVTGILGSLEQPHLDRVMRSNLAIIYQLQVVSGFHKTTTTTYRPRGTLVSIRLHRPLHSMLAISPDIQQRGWASLLLFVHWLNTAFDATV